MNQMDPPDLMTMIANAEASGQWLRFTDADGKETTFSPEQLRGLGYHDYYPKQTWRYVSPLDLIAETAETLRVAHDEFQRTRTAVIAWYHLRRASDAKADGQEAD
jgi:hypothetical protein